MVNRRLVGALPAGVRRWLPYWSVAAAVFVVGAVYGGAVGAERETAVLFPVRSTGEPVRSVSAVDLFVHNARVAGWMVAGGLLFGVPTLYLLLFNGFAFGSVLVDAAGSLGPLRTLLVLAPHGVVELTAFFLAGAIPARWLHVVWCVASGRDRTTPVPLVVLRTLVAVVAVAVLLAVAALLEATVTVTLAGAL